MATTSATITAWDKETQTFLTYVFLNEASNDHIKFIRFRKTNETPRHGFVGIGTRKTKVKVGTPISVLHEAGGIRLYYIDSANKINEIELQNADKDTTDPNIAWAISDNPLDDTPNSVHAASADSYLSATLRNVGEDPKAPKWTPALFYSPPENKERVMMTYKDKDGAWKSGEVYDPTKSSST